MRRQVDPVALVESTERKVWLALVCANLIGAVIATLDGLMGSLIYPGGIPRERFITQLVIGSTGSFAIAVATSRRLIVRPTLAPAVAWILDQRSATAADRAALVAQPRKQATRMLVYWLAFVVAVYPYAHYLIRYRPEPMGFVKAFLFIGLSIVFSATLSYLLVERAIRGLIAHTLRDERSVPRTMGILPRLLLGWTIASGLPLASVAVEVAALDSRQLADSVPVIYMITATGLLFGVVATWLGARAFTDPLQRLRDALGKVADGDLNAEILVEEAGELGELELGFNEMVGGLRERERLRELFDRHVGGDVARFAVGVDGVTRGERRTVSMVFVDVIGSTALAQSGKSPDDVVLILNAFFEVVVCAIGAEKGLVNKIEGDGILGVFGAPRALPDHPARALRAARAIRLALSDQLAATGIDAAIGVTCGQVVAGNLGAAQRYEYTVIGTPVVEATALCDEAKRAASRVLASAAVTEHAGDEAVHWEDAGAIRNGGESPPLFVRQPVGAL